MFELFTHTLVSIVSMIVLYYFLGFGTKDIVNVLKLNFVDTNSIYYHGKKLSNYDKNCSVIVEEEFQIIKLYCDSHFGKKILFRQWERGISFEHPVYANETIIIKNATNKEKNDVRVKKSERKIRENTDKDENEPVVKKKEL